MKFIFYAPISIFVWELSRAIRNIGAAIENLKDDCCMHTHTHARVYDRSGVHRFSISFYCKLPSKSKYVFESFFFFLLFLLFDVGH